MRVSNRGGVCSETTFKWPCVLNYIHVKARRKGFSALSEIIDGYSLHM